MSNETGYPIPDRNARMAENIELMARKMNVQIPPVLSLSGMPLKGSLMRANACLSMNWGLWLSTLSALRLWLLLLTAWRW